MEILPTFLYNIILFLSTILLNFFPRKLVKRKLKRRVDKLPPGSMGWPYLGETLQLYSQNPTNFFTAKETRYGEIFKTHVLGCPAIMLATPEAVWFVLVSHAHLFKPSYPKSKEQLIGPSALFFHRGDYHTRLRKIVHGTLSPEAIKKLLHHIEAAAMSSLNSWATGQLINTFQEMKKFSFEVGVLAIFGHLDEKYKEKLRENYFILDKGYNSFPSNLPGTAYRKAVSARRQLDRVLSEMINERKQKRILENDLLGHLLNFKDENGQTLTEKQIADNIIGVLFAAQDTTASALTWILKYLHDDQNLLEAVKEEQKTLQYEANDRGSQHLTWDRIKKMTLTYRVILESLRMSSIISFTFREATEDVEYKGYLIPKGWKVMPLFRNIHHNPKFFADPQNFSPSRFEAAPKPNTFMPFGNGVHACPGNELAKLEMLILIHHLTTKYRWEVPGSCNGIEYGPFPIPQHGLPAKFWKNSSTMHAEG